MALLMNKLVQSNHMMSEMMALTRSTSGLIHEAMRAYRQTLSIAINSAFDSEPAHKPCSAEAHTFIVFALENKILMTTSLFVVTCKANSAPLVFVSTLGDLRANERVSLSPEPSSVVNERVCTPPEQQCSQKSGR